MNNNTGILVMLVVILIMILIGLVIMYIVVSSKSKGKKASTSSNKDSNSDKSTSAVSSKYNVQSVFDFMNFEKIEDNMIIQKKGKKFLMVIECQGINYDLMSELEKNAVESGYISFLNSLKNPIQIHIQTRTINLEESISNYKTRLKSIEDKLIVQEAQLKQLQKQGVASTKQIADKQKEVLRLRNLYSYGLDIIKNTEMMSLNKNILRKKYYIVASYFYSNTDGDSVLGESEIKEVAFSELYTRCQSMIRVLASTEVRGRVLDSYELADLLYNSYNRDGAETYGVNKAKEAEYDQLYVSSEDAMEKRMKILDDIIDKKALELAEEAILKVNEEKQQELEKKEKNLDDIVEQLAQSIIMENAESLGADVANKSIQYVEKLNKKGKEVDISEEKTRTRTRTKKQ